MNIGKNLKIPLCREFWSDRWSLPKKVYKHSYKQFVLKYNAQCSVTLHIYLIKIDQVNN